MEVVEKTMIRRGRSNGGGGYNEEEVEVVPVEVLPGFRFHPTDEELVGFYLSRKVENKPIPRAFQLIQQLDIYKHDPWDLPRGAAASSSDIIVGEKEKREKLGEWYFYCKRGRKYRNGVRPNRVTGSGFWKATGIDRPIYSSPSSSTNDDQCKNNTIIGLKKSLVYYRGSAGKGTKTDWMMHEFRLFTPPKLHHHRLVNSNNKHIQQLTNYKLINTNYIPSAAAAPHDQQEEAEVWTLCRILKRSVSNKKCIPVYWRSELSSGSATISNDIDGMISSRTYTSTTSAHDNQLLSQQATAAGYNNIIISFRPPAENLDQQMMNDLRRKKQQQPPNGIDHFMNKNNNNNNEEIINGLEMVISSSQLTMSSSSISEDHHDQYCCYLPSPSITTIASTAEASNSSSSSSSSFSTIPADQVNYVVNNFFLNHSTCGDRKWELDDELIKSSSSSFVEFANDHAQAHDDPFFLSHIYT